MKNISFIFICCVLLFGVCSCTNDDTSSDISNNGLNELKLLIEENTLAINELKKKNEELESKLFTLEEDNKNLNDTITELENKISSLENSDKTINSSIDNKYSELKNMINNKMTATGNYTISKEQLLGTWNNIGGSGTVTFANDNTEVFDNWIIYKGNMSVYYMYKDGKLYITDDGMVMTK